MAEPEDGEGDVEFPREWWVNGDVVRRDMALRGFTLEDFVVNKATAKKMLRGGPVTMKSINKVRVAFKMATNEELFSAEELERLGYVPPPPERPHEWLNEWKIEECLSRWQDASNGFQYRFAKLRHRELPNRIARGKEFDLGLLKHERERVNDQLRRHPETCDRVGRHPNVAENITATLDQPGLHWWVIDRWLEGGSLADRLLDGPLGREEAPRVMRGIAEGLSALHKAGVVRRELSPRFVHLRAEDGEPVLTDFELAKILEGAPTVSKKEAWPDDPYRALEVEAGGDVNEQADLYSWGRILAHAVCGLLPAKGREADELAKVSLPRPVLDIATACLRKPRSDRPADIQTVLKAIKSWK